MQIQGRTKWQCFSNDDKLRFEIYIPRNLGSKTSTASCKENELFFKWQDTKALFCNLKECSTMNILSSIPITLLQHYYYSKGNISWSMVVLHI